MTVDRAVAGGRRAAKLLLRDKCKVTRPGVVSDDLDPDGLQVAPTPTVVLAEARCWLDMSARRISSSSDEYVAGDYVKVQRPAISLDLDQPLLHVGDLIEMTASSAAFNVGRVFTVTGLPAGSFAFLSDYSVEEVV